MSDGAVAGASAAPGVPDGAAWAELAALLGDVDALVRAVASGRRRDGAPPWRRVELRPVDLKSGPHLQVVAYDATQAHTANHAAGPPAAARVAELLALPFGHWHVETTRATVQARVTKRGELLVHRKARPTGPEPAPDRGHDQAKQRLVPLDDPLWRALGLADAQGRIKPSRQAKVRQVEEFCRLLDATVSEAVEQGRLRRPSAAAPWRMVDLGCGNAYLTFAAHRLLVRRGLAVSTVGVDVKDQAGEHHAEVAARLAGALGEDLGASVGFVRGGIADAEVSPAPEIVLALHACDTATDDALARAVAWEAPVVLAAPCCHHDVAAQLRTATPPPGHGLLTRHGILRERVADTLTDALRAGALAQVGYRVDVVEFVASAHTPRNTMLRATRRAGGTGEAGAAAAAEYAALVTAWGVRPRLGDLLAAAGHHLPGAPAGPTGPTGP
ncbi:SAM-dependent methyltransferase [Nocardioides sp.]|uniref:class I SAM-dependent methyltransferase n=1 Tax=Nocardioides sp. TaxID=35761 RepID=UPI0035173B3A